MVPLRIAVVVAIFTMQTRTVPNMRSTKFDSHSFRPSCRVQRRLVVSRTQNGSTNGTHCKSCPTPAETAKTIVNIVSEGTLSTISGHGAPLGAPVAFALDRDGHPIIRVPVSSPQHENITRNNHVSLFVQPPSFPARAVASVALVGTAEEASSSGNVAEYKLNVDQCIYYGGLDQSVAIQEIAGSTFASAEPDILRDSAVELITTWNSERAEDIYRIVSSFLGVPLTEMTYAELLWVDRLGMFIRAEVLGGDMQLVRVPFYRPVLDERDARSVITMASQLAWEKERSYVPPVPSIFQDVVSNN